MSRIVLAVVFVVLGHAGAHAQQRSIVGTWADDAATCQTPIMGAVKIGPTLVSDEVSCQFEAVERRGSSVIWNGMCDQGRRDRPTRVMATESALGLVVSFAPGRSWQSLQRCGR